MSPDPELESFLNSMRSLLNDVRPQIRGPLLQSEIQSALDRIEEMIPTSPIRHQAHQAIANETLKEVQRLLPPTAMMGISFFHHFVH